MCRICEGASWDDVIADARRQIAGHGYMLFGVGADEHDRLPWMYTAGLVDTADHPELVVASVATETSAELLDSLARAVVGGDQLDVGEYLGVRGQLVRIGAVDDVQHDLETFAMWHRLHDAGAVHAPLSVVQVVLEHGFCAEHEHAQPLLADPAARVGGPARRENRAARRRRARPRRSRRTSP